MKVAWWRKWHRWIGAVAALFLTFASITGVIVAVTEFFGEDEARREATRDRVSAVSTGDADQIGTIVARALPVAAARAPGAPIDSITMHLKDTPPTVHVYLGRPGGGEDRRLIIDATTGRLVTEAPYVDKAFINRVHSGEAFGDGGLVMAMAWGTALALMSVSGVLIYFSMRRRTATGLRKVFW